MMVADLNPTLVRVLGQLVFVVTLMLVVGTVIFVGTERIERTRKEWVARLRSVAPVSALLAVVLLFNSVARQLSYDLSLIIGWELTTAIYELEGQFLIWLQSFANPPLTAYFSFVYIYGYVFLLVFPLIAYFTLPETRALEEVLTAYTLNYFIGLLCYILFVVYGPRNIMPDLTAGLLYETYPQYQVLTREVNRNTNVFPSLHTSLSVTIALMANRTRTEYPRWFYVATFLAASIAVSTMYLGIHWATDVLGGIVLAYVSVRASIVLVERYSYQWTWIDPRSG